MVYICCFICDIYPDVALIRINEQQGNRETAWSGGLKMNQCQASNIQIYSYIINGVLLAQETKMYIHTQTYAPFQLLEIIFIFHILVDSQIKWLSIQRQINKQPVLLWSYAVVVGVGRHSNKSKSHTDAGFTGITV